MDAAAEIRRNPKLLEQESRRDQERGDPTKASTHAFLDDKAEDFAGRKRRRMEYETTHICYSEYSTGANHSKIGLPYLYGAYR